MVKQLQHKWYVLVQFNIIYLETFQFDLLSDDWCPVSKVAASVVERPLASSIRAQAAAVKSMNVNLFKLVQCPFVPHRVVLHTSRADGAVLHAGVVALGVGSPAKAECIIRNFSIFCISVIFNLQREDDGVAPLDLGDSGTELFAGVDD